MSSPTEPVQVPALARALGAAPASPRPRWRIVHIVHPPDSTDSTERWSVQRRVATILGRDFWAEETWHYSLHMARGALERLKQKRAPGPRRQQTVVHEEAE